MVVLCLFEGGVYLEPVNLEALDELRYSWSRGTCRFGCDALILGCQWVENGENSEGFVASTKRKFLSLKR